MLDLFRGELLPGLEAEPYRIVPASKWHDTAIFAPIHERAQHAFARALLKRRKGLQLKLHFAEHEVLVQEYPRRSPPCVVFIFCKDVHGKPRYHTEPVDLSPGIIAGLRQANRWNDDVPLLGKWRAHRLTALASTPA